jgi:hypothetical protein
VWHLSEEVALVGVDHFFQDVLVVEVVPPQPEDKGVAESVPSLEEGGKQGGMFEHQYFSSGMTEQEGTRRSYI